MGTEDKAPKDLTEEEWRELLREETEGNGWVRWLKHGGAMPIGKREPVQPEEQPTRQQEDSEK